MKLCRFELREAPGPVRSGILYDNRLYETDGQNAIGIHELGDIVLLPPVGNPPSIRAFRNHMTPEGDTRLSYEFINPGRLIGPGATYQTPERLDEIGFEARVCCIVADDGEQIEHAEAPGFVLGLTLLTNLTAPEEFSSAKLDGSPPGHAKDLALGVGPYIVTPDELGEHTTAEEPTAFKWTYMVRVNEHTIASGILEPDLPFAHMLQFASRYGPIRSGELIAGPRLPVPPLPETALGRGLLPGDRLDVIVEGIGILVTRLA